jgi:predicted MFS family arabinose efflux permease
MQRGDGTPAGRAAASSPRVAVDRVDVPPPGRTDEAPPPPERARRRTTYREVFAPREWRFLYGALVFSLLGDQLAKVALSILVYVHTSSPLLTAVTYGISYLPWVVGGPLLSAFADRFPRRRVLLLCDLSRMVLVGLMALPGVPVAALVATLFVASMFTPPFESARSALFPEILDGDAYVVGNAVTTTTYQVGQLVGFIAGGALVAALTARGALAVDALSFLFSAGLIWLGVRARPAPERSDTKPPSVWRETAAGARLVFTNRRLRSIVLIVWAASAFAYAWEGLAAPWAHQFGGGARTVGLLLGINPLGVIVGSIVIGRFCSPETRSRLTLPLALAAPLLLVAVLPIRHLALVLVVLAASGFASSFNIALNATFVRAVAPEFRARAFGLAQGGLMASQGIAVLAAGIVADWTTPSASIAVFGLAGACIVGAVALRWPRDAEV